MSETEVFEAELVPEQAMVRAAPITSLDVMPAITIDQAVARYAMFKEFVNKVLEKESDYGTIPGTKKDTLYKSGAEKLCMFFGLSVRLRLADKVEDWTGENHNGEPFFYYRYACDLYKGDVLFATSEGSCNSQETKYRWRQGERLCPECGSSAIIKGKKEYDKTGGDGGWLCFGKKGGCGAKFGDNDTAITGQTTERVPNPDIADIVNTLQKMAEKRAFVGTTLLAVNASAYFTQDMEDMPREATAPAKQAVDTSVKKEASKPPTTRPSASKANGKVTDAQANAIAKISGALNLSSEQLKPIFADAGCTDPSKLTAEQAGEIIANLNTRLQNEQAF